MSISCPFFRQHFLKQLMKFLIKFLSSKKHSLSHEHSLHKQYLTSSCINCSHLFLLQFEHIFLHVAFSFFCKLCKYNLMLIQIPSVHLRPLTSKVDPVNSFKKVRLSTKTTNYYNWYFKVVKYSIFHTKIYNF